MSPQDAQIAHDQSYALSEASAKADFSWFGDPLTPQFKRAVEIDAELERTAAPLFRDPNKPYLLAQRVSREIAEEKVAFARAVWASRARVFEANWILADAKSIYRAKFNELEAKLRVDPAATHLFTTPDWPEKVFEEFTRRYGQIPAVFRTVTP